MPVKLKIGALLATVVTGSVFGLREILSDGDQIVLNKEVPESDLTPNDLSSPNPVSEIETLSTWTPEKVPNADESHETIGIGNSDTGMPFPTNYKYSSNGNNKDFLLEHYSEEERIEKRKEAAKIYGTLNDYTFKFFMPCGSGTGFILDYEIPKQGEYPTKWYIATNLHVIWRLRFSNENNIYGQKLHYSNTDYLRKNSKGQYDQLMKYDGEVRKRCDDGDRTGYLDFNISQQQTGKERRADIGGVVQKQIKEPRLFYAAFNFLDPDVARSKNIPANNHFSDFAVIEVEFTDQKEAEKATNGFASKYKSKADAINFLGDPIEKKYDSKDKLWKARDNYYIFGYPVVDGTNKWDPTANFNPNTAIASHLFSWIYDEKSKDKYKGFVDVKDSGGFEIGKSKFRWSGEDYYEFGHRYKFREHPMAPGSSGAMYVDGDGTAVGIIVRTTGNKHGTGGSSSWAQPFRSIGLKGDGFDTPAYDLIQGVEKQRNSYKQQVVKYLLNNGKRTWLSEKGQWKATKEVA